MKTNIKISLMLKIKIRMLNILSVYFFIYLKVVKIPTSINNKKYHSTCIYLFESIGMRLFFEVFFIYKYIKIIFFFIFKNYF